MRIVVGMTPRTGRPPSEDPRSVVLSLRLTAAESEALWDAAERAGQTVTVFVRERALVAAKRTR